MSYTKFNRIFYKLINTILVILIGISLFFSLQSDILSIDKLTNLFIKFFILFFYRTLYFYSLRQKKISKININWTS